MYGKQSPVQERLISSCPYVLPMVQALPLGVLLYQQFPPLAVLVGPLFPLFPILEGNFLISLLVFFGLFLGIVRNPSSFSRFVRFNTMQALLMVIGLSLLQMTLGFLGPLFGGIVTQTMASGLFLLTFVIAIYSIFQLWQGKYADVPVLSEAANSQVY